MSQERLVEKLYSPCLTAKVPSICQEVRLWISDQDWLLFGSCPYLVCCDNTNGKTCKSMYKRMKMQNENGCVFRIALWSEWCLRHRDMPRWWRFAKSRGHFHNTRHRDCIRRQNLTSKSRFKRFTTCPSEPESPSSPETTLRKNGDKLQMAVERSFEPISMFWAISLVYRRLSPLSASILSSACLQAGLFTPSTSSWQRFHMFSEAKMHKNAKNMKGTKKWFNWFQLELHRQLKDFTRTCPLWSNFGGFQCRSCQRTWITTESRVEKIGKRKQKKQKQEGESYGAPAVRGHGRTPLWRKGHRSQRSHHHS